MELKQAKVEQLCPARLIVISEKGRVVPSVERDHEHGRVQKA